MSSLDSRVGEYHRLKKMRESLTTRIEELGKQIKAELPEGKHLYGNIAIEVQVRNRTALDEFVAEEILQGLNLLDECTKWVVDADAVESFYLQGKISDADLRQMRKPQYSVALITKEVELDV